MLQTPIQPIQLPPIQSQPMYNAVKIDIHNPQVNAQKYNLQNPIQQPNYTSQVYDYPKAPIYDVPQSQIYQPQGPATACCQPKAVQEVPAVPPPVVVQQNSNQEVSPATVQTASPEVVPVPPAVVSLETAPAAVATAPSTVETASVAVATAPQAVEVKAPETIKPQIDLNEFISKLTNPDYEIQANAMETIAEMAQKEPDKATDLLDVKVIDALLGIMQADSSKLEGPTPAQLDAREKIMGGKSVTEAETAEANKVAPMELVERNKQYSIYTIAILDKLYVSEIEKMNKTIVPMTELPGAAGIVEQIKNNPNPMVRISAIDAMSYIQRPEYKQDLNTLFSVAKNDKDVNVQTAAQKALDKLTQLPDVTATVAPEVTVTPENAEKKVA